jgi:alanine racemase
MGCKKYNIIMRNLIKRLSKSRYNYRPLIEIDLNRSHILGNLHAYEKAHPRLSIAPVLKSNAYGHGLIEIASILKDEGRIPFFVIDTYFEAIQIRNAGIKRPLLVLGYTPIETIIHSNLKNISFMIGDVSLLKDLYSRAKNKANIHIKIDTGMHRQGINVDEITTVFDIIKTKQNILIEGICSHLSDADNSNETFSKSQIILWNKLVARFKDQIPTLRYIHLSSTAGHRFSQEIDANVSRLGIGLYGLDRQNSLPGLDLRPVLSMKTVISTIRKIKKGDSLGYSNTFTAPNDMIIATILEGYGCGGIGIRAGIG